MPKCNFKFRNPNFLASIQEDIFMARNPKFGFRIRKAWKLGLDDTPQPKSKAGARWIVVKVRDLNNASTYIYFMPVYTNL